MPRIEPHVVSDAFDIDGVHVQPLPVLHGGMQVFGYRIGRLSYITDCSEIPPETYSLLRGTSVLVLGVLRYAPHPTHLNLEAALQIIDRVEPERAFFTHLSHDFDHDRTNAELPEKVRLSYDGLKLEIEDE